MSAVKDKAVVSHGVATITRGTSVHDYFAQKLSATSNKTEDQYSHSNPQSCDSTSRSCDLLTKSCDAMPRSCDFTSKSCDSFQSCDSEPLYSSSPNSQQLLTNKSSRLIEAAAIMDTELVARRKGRKKRKKLRLNHRN